MAVRGITKIRNEAHIIADTLDNWAQYCDAIHVYCDACTDDTAAICRAHPCVVEVMESDCMDPDRERAEWFNRHTVLHSARRFMSPLDWIVNFDGDEHLYNIDPTILDVPDVQVVVCRSYDTYITEEDKELTEREYSGRRWVGPEWEWAPYFYSNRFPWDFTKPDQRNMSWGALAVPKEAYIVHGAVRHWGKGLSVQKFEDKCKYYAETFGPRYADKWEKRRGRAVHTVSDFGQELVEWERIISGEVTGPHRRTLELCQ
jgi:hypothetical protein